MLRQRIPRAQLHSVFAENLSFGGQRVLRGKFDNSVVLGVALSHTTESSMVIRRCAELDLHVIRRGEDQDRRYDRP
jgi:hypothetical protein